MDMMFWRKKDGERGVTSEMGGKKGKDPNAGSEEKETNIELRYKTRIFKCWSHEHKLTRL